jgi:hypothetical protein
MNRAGLLIKNVVRRVPTFTQPARSESTFLFVIEKERDFHTLLLLFHIRRRSSTFVVFFFHVKH